MATTATRKLLGQAIQAVANTDQDLYTVPAATDTVVSCLIVTNQAATAATYMVKHRAAGAASATKQQLFSAVSLPPNSSDVICQGIVLQATDVLTVQASATTVSWNLYGQENS